MRTFLLGAYVAVAIVVFAVTLFLCLLGGDANDLWKPLVYAIFWPIVLWRMAV